MLPQSSDQDGDAEKQLIVAQGQHNLFEHGSPEVFTVFSNLKWSQQPEFLEYPAIDGIVVVAP